MSRAMRMIWVVTLVIFAGGCSSYSVVYPTVGADEPAPVGGWENNVKSGDKVRVTLTDDSKIKGKITDLSTGSLVVETGPSYEKESIVISQKEVRVIELRVGHAGRTTLVVIGVVVGLIAVGVIVTGETMSGVGNTGFQ